MSLNDYFAANGSVYLRPMGINDCFNMPGLPPPHALKPLQHPQQKPPRSMAAVSPLHLPPYEGGGFGGPQPPNNRTSSFAAALRKLAKQAVDPVAGEKDPSSPVSSPLPHTPKRPPSFLATHQGTSYGGGSSPPPPVVTIAPSRPVATHTADSRKVVDLSSAPPNSTNTPLSNGHLPETMKMDSSKRHDKWEESTLSKSCSSSSTSQVRPHATIAPLPRPDDSVTSSRGFQPYRGGGGGASEDPPRNTLPHHPLSLFEHPAAYPYAPAAAFLPPPHMPHPAYRLDDPLYLERYLRPPMLPYGQPALMGPPFYPGSRYDLLAHSLSLSNSSIINHERMKAEEQDRRLREKELELKEQERQRDRESREKEHRERRKEEQSEHRKSSSSSSSSYSSKRTESPSVRNNSSIPNNVPVTVVSSSSASIPLNLVLQSAAELPRKESTELWMPWQQPTATKDANHEAKHPAFRTQDNQRHHQTNDKLTHRFSPPTSLSDKKLSPTNETTNSDRKQHLDLNNRTPVDSRSGVYQEYHQRALSEQQHRSGNSHEAPHKDSSVPHEWRHEKLQKACTNIHRKTHESKKKDGGLYPLGHRKNGAVFAQGTKSATAAPPLLYQNEGMHARLVESEKCRLEMNGHAPVKATVVAPTPYKTMSSVGHYAVQQHQSKEPSCHNNNKSFSDYFVTHPKCSDLVPPVVSKLDLDLKRLRRGQRPTHEDEEREEKRIRSLLIVARVPRIKLDTNPNKLNFLRMFGLTTHLKKKKIEFDMFLKRRKRLRLDTSSPIISDDPSQLKREPDDFDDLTSVNSLKIERLSERLRAEDCGPAKENFLAVVGLKPLSNEQKEAKDCQRRKVYDEKCRRHFRFLANVNRKSSPKRLFVPKSEAARRLDHLRKLNEMNSLTTSPEEEEETKHTPAPKMEQVPYPSPVSKCNKYSFKRGHSLKREFRFATPHSTKSKCERVLKNEAAPSAPRCIATQVDAAELGVSELKSSLSSSATIEVLMSVILRNQTEQSGEKNMLNDRCQQLRQTHEELKKQAEALTRHMSDLLRSKRELDEERQRSQKSIDHLKKCLQVGR